MYIVRVWETPKGLRLSNLPKAYYRSNFYRKYKGVKKIYTHPNKWIEAPNYLKKEQGGFLVYKDLRPLIHYYKRSLKFWNLWWCESGSKEFIRNPTIKESKWSTTYQFVDGLLVPREYDIMNEIFCERIKLIQQVSMREIKEIYKEIFPLDFRYDWARS